MSESKPKKSTSPVAPNRALRALARLLGRQSACQFLAEMEMQDPAALVNPAHNVFRSSDTTTKAT